MDGTTSNGTSRRLVARVSAVIAIAAVAVALVDRHRWLARLRWRGRRPGGAPRPAARASRPSSEEAAVYVVQPNDTLAGIAETTGVPVEELQNLNPDIDPQALPSGATLKLR